MKILYFIMLSLLFSATPKSFMIHNERVNFVYSYNSWEHWTKAIILTDYYPTSKRVIDLRYNEFPHEENKNYCFVKDPKVANYIIVADTLLLDELFSYDKKLLLYLKDHYTLYKDLKKTYSNDNALRNVDFESWELTLSQILDDGTDDGQYLILDDNSLWQLQGKSFLKSYGWKNGATILIYNAAGAEEEKFPYYLAYKNQDATTHKGVVGRFVGYNNP